MPIIIITALILFFIKIVRDSLYFAWLWQVKEYRIDRMISRLKEDSNLFKNNISYLFAIFLLIALFLIPENYLTQFLYVVLLFFIYNALQVVKEIKNRSLKRPKQTIKILLIFSAMIILYFLFFAFYWIPDVVYPVPRYGAGMTIMIKLMLLIYVANFFVISSIILAINPFFNFQKRRIIKKTTLKMRRLKRVKVIGITGSYGKTSTKEFLYEILSQKYKVIKTEGNNNTNIGVAYTVLNKVSDDYDYFICEMGAYKIGEIAEICEIVKPKIGILTGINEQHIDLFGSQENIVKAKFELIKSLPKNGLAVINEKLKVKSMSSRYIGDEKLQFKVKNIKYFSLDNINNIKVCQDCVEFNYQTIPNPSLLKEGNEKGVQDNKVKFKVNILGKHYIENLLSAIIVAEYLGMNLEEIAKAMEKIKPTEFMMRKVTGLNDSVFIDGSYSANPDGVTAALDYLSEAYKDYKKIIVFPGVIELGKSSEKIHKKLFDKIGKICNTAYILNTEYQILNTKNKCKFIFEKDFDKVAQMLKNNLDKNTVVLFESRGARIVLNKLLNDN